MPEKLIAVLPLRDIVLFPGITMPFLVGRPKSARAVDQAVAKGTDIVFIAQKEAAREEVTESDLYRIGTVGRIVEHVSAGSAIKLLVEGRRRARLVRLVPNDDFLEGVVELLEDPVRDAGAVGRVSDEILSEARQFLGPSVTDEAAKRLKLPDSDAKVAELQALLEADLLSLEERLERLRDRLS
ncbi:MAG TPA: LON peptidase substrate-binding domain-containing protein [Alphaproteobacteria bacterium]|nr:LON peptidase substrate-binding domain-containing protein [Alphaproteobacteria bacterium]